MPCPHRGRRRSNVVGASSSTSTPRWPSRHRTASSKRERPSLAILRVRRRAAHRDLRERVAERASPAAQGRPRARALSRELPGAHPSTHLANRRLDNQPQRQGHRDRREPVVLARRHAPRHHEQNRVALGAQVASTREHDRRRWTIDGDGAAQLPLPKPMAVYPEPSTGLATRRPTTRANGGTGLVDGRWRLQPGLDVARVMNDS